MKIALVDNIRTVATKGTVGVCPCCESQVIAKCGEIRVDHWAHKGARHCDPWWENETEWHRSWKGNFSSDWQEVVAIDEQTGEKHIADIKTDHGLVVEFQHSRLDPKERRKREVFYKNMIWVVDGTRLKGDYPRFLNGRQNFIATNMNGVFHSYCPEDVFPSNWTLSSVPVIFDFKGVEPLTDQNDLRNTLCLLLPRGDKYAIIAYCKREWFIDVIKNGNFFGKETPKTHVVKPIAKKTTAPSSQYILHKGRFVRRRRF